jgi:hypothetical protein
MPVRSFPKQPRDPTGPAGVPRQCTESDRQQLPSQLELHLDLNQAQRYLRFPVLRAEDAACHGRHSSAPPACLAFPTECQGFLSAFREPRAVCCWVSGLVKEPTWKVGVFTAPSLEGNDPFPQSTHSHFVSYTAPTPAIGHDRYPWIPNNLPPYRPSVSETFACA